MNDIEGVLVVGAGPVGFVTALGLARAGIKVTIIEAEEKINDSPRAAVYMPVTLELLDKIGIIDDAHAVGYRNAILQTIFNGLDGAIQLNADVLKDDTPYPYQLHFGQNLLAGIVQKHLLAMPGTEVRFNTRLTALSQDGEGVTATLSTPDGTEQVRCDWLVGADGGRSSVRKALGLAFQGHTWHDRFVATNIRYTEFAEHGFAPANFFCDPRRWAVVAVIGNDDLWRVTYNEDPDISDEAALARVPECLASLLPGSGNYELVAASPYRVHERASERFRVGRVLLAGDAAHVCNPCGGLGLTTGLMDADALMDALGAVINADADESLLDFYAEDRRRVFLEFSSPGATEYRRLLMEADPDRRREDMERLRHIADDPVKMRETMLMTYQVRGRPMRM